MRFALTVIVSLCVIVCSVAQKSISSIASSSEMSVLGTSTLHDWESIVEDFSVTAVIDGDELKNVEFAAKVESIKSGKSAMDKNTYNALKSDKYPMITFTAESMAINGMTVKGSGKLNIAGVTKSKSLDLTVESWAEGSYLVIGSVSFNMSEFGVDPPKAMMGAIKTGDEITVKFEVTMNVN